MVRRTSVTPKTSAVPEAAPKPPKAAKAQGPKTPAKAAKRPGRRATPSPETLTELGLDRLIRLVLDETERNPAFKKLVTAALAGLQGPDAVAALVDRRLTALERARGYVDWQKRRAFAIDLDATVSTLVRELAPLDAGMALDRLIRFLGGADAVLERVDDSAGQVHGVYERAADAAATLAASLSDAEAARFAARLVPMVEADAYGFIDDLLHALIPKLPEAALTGLDAALAAALPPQAKPDRGDDGRSYAQQRLRGTLVRLRQALADRRGDVDAFIGLETGLSAERPDRVGVAERLLAAGRAGEALDWIRKPQARGLVVVTREAILTGTFDPEAPEHERKALEIRILDALGRGEEAQVLRWSAFEKSLDREMLRAHIAKLPDFEDEEALERAFEHAAAHRDPYRALHFFTHWPHPARAARLVEDRLGQWEGGRYEVLVPAAKTLEHSHPVAASRLYRLLIDDILERGRSAAYGHGARHLATLDALAETIPAGALDPDPAAYREALRKAHGRKSAFWSQVTG